MNTTKITTIALTSALLLTAGLNLGCKKNKNGSHRDVPYMPLPRVESAQFNYDVRSKRNNYRFIQPDNWGRNFYKKMRMGNYI